MNKSSGQVGYEAMLALMLKADWEFGDVSLLEAHLDELIAKTSENIAAFGSVSLVMPKDEEHG